MIDIHFGDNLDILPALPDGSFDLIYIDPPFNTGEGAGADGDQDHSRRER